MAQGGSAIAQCWLEPGGIHHTTVSKKIPKPCYFWDKLVQDDIAKWPEVAPGSGHSPGAATLHGGMVRTLFQRYLNFNFCRLMVSTYRYHSSKPTVEISSGCENGH